MIIGSTLSRHLAVAANCESLLGLHGHNDTMSMMVVVEV